MNILQQVKLFLIADKRSPGIIPCRIQRSRDPGGSGKLAAKGEFAGDTPIGHAVDGEEAAIDRGDVAALGIAEVLDN